MPQRRYRPPSSAHRDEESLPLDTICTILTRQSTLAQGARNLFSDEPNRLTSLRSPGGWASRLTASAW